MEEVTKEQFSKQFQLHDKDSGSPMSSRHC